VKYFCWGVTEKFWCVRNFVEKNFVANMWGVIFCQKILSDDLPDVGVKGRSRKKMGSKDVLRYHLVFQKISERHRQMSEVKNATATK
jgi:hypothetical protein